MKWQKKPQVFEANQYTGPVCVPRDDPLPSHPEGVGFEALDMTFDRYPYVVTAHKQRVYLAPGDWVVAEPDGRGYYPIKDDIIRTIADPVT